MRQLLLALAVAGTLSGAANAQMLKAIVADTHPGSSNDFSTSCSEANTFLNTRVGGISSGVSTTIAGYYNTLICGLVTDGNWSSLDALYILAAPTTTIAEMNLVSSSFTLVPQGTGTFTTNSDYTGNGSTGYLDTQFTPSTAGGQYTATSASVGAYVINNIGGQTAMAAMEVTSTGNKVIQVLPLYPAVGSNIHLNDTTNVLVNTVTNSSGCFTGRNNGTQIANYSKTSATDTVNTASTSSPLLPDLSIYIGANHNSGATDRFSTYAVSAAFLGGDQDVTHLTSMCSRINAFMTSQGVNAY